MKGTFLLTMITLLTLGSFSSCSKKSDGDPGANNRKIKYEITGTFSGKLLIVYNDNISGNTTLTNVALPWTKEIEYGSNVQGIGIGAQASVMGTQGQTATLKIYSGENLVKSSTATAGTLGEIVIPTTAYGF